MPIPEATAASRAKELRRKINKEVVVERYLDKLSSISGRAVARLGNEYAEEECWSGDYAVSVELYELLDKCRLFEESREMNTRAARSARRELREALARQAAQ